MDKEYFFHCRGCKKPDKEYPMNFDDYEYGEVIKVNRTRAVVRIDDRQWNVPFSMIAKEVSNG